MNIVLQPKHFNKNCIFISDPIKNTIIQNGDFIKIIYSNSKIVMNGIYLNINLKNIEIENKNNKIYLKFDKIKNKETLDYIEYIENNILEKYTCRNKNSTIKLLKDYLNNEYLRIYKNDEKSLIQINNNNINLVLKISGIWDDFVNYGITFKFIYFSHQLKNNP
tara:strand:- start:87 stop:578 length:492 start_codon:yes stop_codon:yes gene_type:complete